MQSGELQGCSFVDTQVNDHSNPHEQWHLIPRERMEDDCPLQAFLHEHREYDRSKKGIVCSTENNVSTLSFRWYWSAIYVLYSIIVNHLEDETIAFEYDNMLYLSFASWVFGTAAQKGFPNIG